ncbi:MAG: hypothetical protein SFV21_21975 [Rhodospirillaceae bacterium]|nr:hypothetical protein [Rhodospirillaceae bacterium]
MTRRTAATSLAAMAGLGVRAATAAEGEAAPTGPIKVPTGPGLLFREGPPGWWDSERCSCPRVLRGADGVWRMWYYGRDPDFDDSYILPTGRIGLATSSDGIAWQRVRGPLTMGAVLEPSADETRFDSGHVGVGGVSHDNDQYVMWYFGGDRSLRPVGPGGRGGGRGFPLRPGRATSPDGITWTRDDGPYRGAFLDVGAAGEFDAVMVGWPHLLKEDDGSYKLYYHTLSPAEGFMACAAASADGRTWEKIGPVLKKGPEGNFDQAGVASRHVSKVNGRYVMFYEGNDGRWFGGIGMAESADGITFTRVKGPDRGGSMLASPPRDGDRFDSHGIGTPWLVPMEDGSFRLYYVGATSRIKGDLESGESRNIHRIGLALSDGMDLTKWRRWDGA